MTHCQGFRASFNPGFPAPYRGYRLCTGSSAANVLWCSLRAGALQGFLAAESFDAGSVTSGQMYQVGLCYVLRA